MRPLLVVLLLAACATVEPQPPKTQPPTTVSLEAQIDLEVQACTNTMAFGYVTNNSAETVDVFVEAHFLDGNGDVIEDSNDWVRGLRAGERGRWEAPWLGKGIYRECRANVDGVFGE